MFKYIIDENNIKNNEYMKNIFDSIFNWIDTEYIFCWQKNKEFYNVHLKLLYPFYEGMYLDVLPFKPIFIPGGNFSYESTIFPQYQILSSNIYLDNIDFEYITIIEKNLNICGVSYSIIEFKGYFNKKNRIIHEWQSKLEQYIEKTF